MKAFKLLIAFAHLLFISFVPFICHATPGTVANKIVFFGDSLTDNGNLYYVDLKYIPKNPPYFEGRFSNGYVWSDHAADHFLKNNAVESTNYAFGGETADGYLPYSLSFSKNSYLLHNMLKDKSHSVFIIWIGANDYIPAIKPDDVDKLTTSVVGSIQAAIESLIYHGGLNFLIINLPDLGKTPFAAMTKKQALLNTLTIEHNLKLAAMVNNINSEYKTINIKLFDINALFDDFIINTDVYNKKYNVNITQKNVSCWDGGYSLQLQHDMKETIEQQLDSHLKKQMQMQPDIRSILPQYIASSPALLETYQVGELAGTRENLCTNPEEYIFWDHIHPTGVTHMMLSQELIQYIESSFDLGERK